MAFSGSSQEIFRVCVIGTGMIATQAHLPAFQRMPEKYAIAAVCDSKAESAENAARQFGAPHWYTDAEEMFTREKPDVAVICTSNLSHKPYVMMALSHGCHVLCEKPIAFTYADAVEMYGTAERKGLLLEACQTLRFLPDRLAAKALIESGDAGEIYAGRLVYLRRRGIPTWGKFHRKEFSGGGAFIDLGVHMLDSAVWLMNNTAPREVTASFSKKIPFEFGGAAASGAFAGGADSSRFNPDEMNVEEFAIGSVRFENDAMLEFNIAWQSNAPAEISLRLLGDKCGIDLPDGKLYRGIDTDTTLAMPEDRFKENPFYGHTALIADFYETLRGRKPLFVKSAETLCVSAILDMAMRSAEEKRAVSLGELNQ